MPHSSTPERTGRPGIERESIELAGQRVDVFTLASSTGLELRFMTWGGVILSIKTPDRNGVLRNVALAYPRLSDYVNDPCFIGPLVGRYANRIAGARFTLGGVEYRLAANDGANHLHGGASGFHQRVWSAEPFEDRGDLGVRLHDTSPAGEEGFPGTLATRVTYTLTRRNELCVDYRATTDAATPVNLTQHTYFNLAGGSDILDHELTLNASRFTPVTASLIPTGERRPVAGTPFDFTAPYPIGARIDEDDEQLRHGDGYDHNYILDRTADDTPCFAARLSSPLSGRAVEVFTTEPGIQFYSGNSLGHGLAFRRRGGVALETQHFPDSPNQPQFPSTILRPGEVYRSRTVYRFSVDLA